MIPTRAARDREQRATRNYVAAVAGIVVAAAVLRFYRLGANSFWIDEINVMSYIRSSNFLEAVRSRGGPLESPVHLVAVWGALRLPVDFETAARVPAALFGVLEVLALMLFARRATGRRAVALTAGALLAVAPFAIRYSQEVRYYTAFSAVHLLTWWLWLRAVQRTDRRAWVWWGLAAGLILLTHPYGPLVVGFQFVVGIVTARRRPRPERSRVRRDLAVGLLVATIVAAPWFVWGAFRWIPDNVDGRSYKLNAAVSQPVTLSADLFTRISQWLGANGGRWTLLSVLVALLCLGAVVWGEPEQRRAARLIGAYLVGFVVLLVPLARLLNTYFAMRRVEFLLAGILLLTAMGVPAVQQRYRTYREAAGPPVDPGRLRALGMVIVAALVVLSLGADVVYETTQKTGYRQLAAALRETSASDEIVIGPVDPRWPASIRSYLRWRGIDRKVHFLLPGQKHVRIPRPDGGEVVWVTGAAPVGKFSTRPLNSLRDLQVIAGDRTQPGSILPLYLSHSAPRDRAEFEQQLDTIRALPVLLPPTTAGFPWSILSGR